MSVHLNIICLYCINLNCTSAEHLLKMDVNAALKALCFYCCFKTW